MSLILCSKCLVTILKNELLKINHKNNFTYKNSEINHLVSKNHERIRELSKKDVHMSWEFAKMCFFAGEMQGYRSEELVEEYAKARDKNNLIWKDIESQIKCEVFEMPKEKDNNTGLFHVPKPIKSML